MAYILVLVLLLAAPVSAQQLPTAGQRRAADIASWVTVGTTVTIDTVKAWQSDDRAAALRQEGLRIGVTYAAVFAAKWLVHRDRPCAPDCGGDNPSYSFFSGHTALAFSTVGGPRLSVSLPFAIGTGGLRVAAGKHWPTDVLVGAGVGLLTSRIR